MISRNTLTTEELRASVLRHLTYNLGRDPDHAVLEDWRMALSYAVRDRIVDAWFAAGAQGLRARAKRVYYLSMEFLIGRLLEDGIVNLRLVDAGTRGDGALGPGFRRRRGGRTRRRAGQWRPGPPGGLLPRILSTLGCPAYGYGIRYEHGLFRQSLRRRPPGRDARGLAAPAARLGIRAPRGALPRSASAAMSTTTAGVTRWTPGEHGRSPRPTTRRSSAGRADGPTRCGCGRPSRPRSVRPRRASTGAISPARPSPRRWPARSAACSIPTTPPSRARNCG